MPIETPLKPQPCGSIQFDGGWRAPLAQGVASPLRGLGAGRLTGFRVREVQNRSKMQTNVNSKAAVQPILGNLYVSLSYSTHTVPLILRALTVAVDGFFGATALVSRSQRSWDALFAPLFVRPSCSVCSKYPNLHGPQVICYIAIEKIQHVFNGNFQ